jgi:DNA-binding response OmpR family regulator
VRGVTEAEPAPALVVIDEALPDISGADIIGRLHGDMATDRVPTLLLKSSTEDRNPAEQALYANGEVLEKPFAPEDFISCVNDVLGGVRNVSTAQHGS